MKIDAPWIAAAAPVLSVLTDAGHRALFVGGCVRNALLGAGVSDIDIATDALPETVQALASAFRTVPTGIDHGTVTIIAEGVPYEVTTFRRDVETDGRRAVVAFSRDVAEDAARRDFTMNALYAEPDGTVIDPLGGLPDLLARRVRFIGDAHARIHEDHLRILRFFRFTAIYGRDLDAEGLAACAELADGIDQLSRERVGAEMKKLLAAPDPAPAVAAMAQAGILARVLPGADAKALPILIHLEDAAPDPIRRLAALGGEVDLRLSRAETARLTLIRTAALEGNIPETAWRHGAGIAHDAALVRAALTETPPATEGIAAAAAARFPVSAADLMPALSGAALGQRLKVLEAQWIASGFHATKAELLG